MLEKLHSFEEELFGYPSISHKAASPERKKTGKKHGIENQAEDLDQKGAAGNRVEQSGYRFRSDQSGQPCLRQSRRQRNDHA